ncbi:D-galactonate dehydratase [Tolypocladium ophioglossoides CBS 100239]|uniref:D-galactonate dehydratase n=1 Tax=Tolypocladium ophioglossoides (strain CBS 100239) TaxID=1163406 RepID=A0A0L0NCU5_TOLOC|nr:D-galactonate dehydratase [Tolypocladium ophioglossoides CBS 100239]
MGQIAKIEYFRVPPRLLFVKITDEHGNVGRHPRPPQTGEGCLELAGSIGVEQIWQISWRKSFYRGGPVVVIALSGRDIVLWDLKGSFNVPTHPLLSGKLRDRRPSDVETQALPQVQGFTAVEMNGTEDLAWLHAEGIRALAQLTTISVALGERRHSRWGLNPFLEAPACVNIVQPDICHVGGISELRRMAAYPSRRTARWALSPWPRACCYIKNPKIWDIADGYIGLMKGPGRAGLGIEIDEGLVRGASGGAEPWVSPGFAGPERELREW